MYRKQFQNPNSEMFITNIINNHLIGGLVEKNKTNTLQ